MKKIFLVAFVALISTVAYAQTFASFSFEKTDGTVTSLPAVGTKITFPTTALSAVNAAHNATVQLTSLGYMYFSQEASTAVDDVLNAQVQLLSTNHTIQLTAPAGMRVNVLNVAGQQIATQITTGSQQNIATQLPQGMYIVQVGSQTFKTIVK